MSLVGIAKMEKGENIQDVITRVLNLIRFNFSTKIESIVIKPNLCYYWDYTTGQTTSPYFIEALIEVLKKQMSHNITISIVESDASAMRCKYSFKVLGYEKMAARQDVRLVNLTNEAAEPETIIINGKKFTFNTPKIIKNADLRINVPKPKYWPGVKITCALKNIYGCNPYPKKYEYHKHLDEVIVALNKLMKFDLCILDGIIVAGNNPKKIGLVMASTDPVAFDSVVAKIMRINPKSMKYLMLAQKEGLGQTKFTPIGVPLSLIQKEFPRKKLKSKIFELAYRTIYYLGLEKRLGIE